MEEKREVRLAKPYFPDGTMEAIEKVLESGWVAGGEIADEFAMRVAKIEDYEYGVAVNSCTSALQLALEIMPDMPATIRIPNITYPATANAVLAAGYFPLITDRSFDVGVDLFGLKEGDRCWAIGDCACSLGSKGNGTKPDIACYSFHPRKIVSTGEGGALCMDNENLYERARELVNHGQYDEGFGFGYNMRMSDINAAIGNVQLEELEQTIDARQYWATTYNDNLLAGVKIFGQHDREMNEDYNYQSFVVELPCTHGELDMLMDKLREDGIECNFGTYRLNQMPYYREYLDPYAIFDNPTYLALPMHMEMTAGDITYVCDRLEKHLKELHLDVCLPEDSE